jgi:hypothetical protein
MHPLPPADELQSFVGDAIAQVSLDPFGVHFSFESMRWLAAYHRVEHVEADGIVWGYDCEAAEGPPLVLHRLLYRRIEAVEREELAVTFRMEGGSALKVFSELGPYESGLLGGPEKELAVF